MNVRKKINIQGDREFHALSESIISFSKRSFYSDEKFKKLFLMTKKKSSRWESGHEGAFIALKLFFQ
jgi:hypothetical protein